jgi:uncharacterized protein
MASPLAKQFESYRRVVGRGGDVQEFLKDHKRDVSSWREAAASDDVAGLVLHGEALAAGIDAEPDADEAFARFGRAVDLGSADAQYLVGECYTDGAGCPRDRQKAFDYHQRAAEQRHGPAEFAVGLAHYEGLVVKPNNYEAAKWFLQSANHGYPPAMYKLGKMLLDGKELKRDIEFGLQLLGKAADARFAKAECAMGLYHRNPLLGPPNDREALRWFKRASESGSPEAMYQIGLMFYGGVSVRMDMLETAEWYAKAAEAGHAEAAYKLGLMFRDGHNPQYAEAARWFSLAAKHGHKEASWALQEIRA